jgi:hypothetical protein
VAIKDLAIKDLAIKPGVKGQETSTLRYFARSERQGAGHGETRSDDRRGYDREELSARG